MVKFSIRGERPRVYPRTDGKERYKKAIYTYETGGTLFTVYTTMIYQTVIRKTMIAVMNVATRKNNRYGLYRIVSYRNGAPRRAPFPIWQKRMLFAQTYGPREIITWKCILRARDVEIEE